MSAKKIKLNSSLNAINAKAATGKRKVAPKLKAALANPYQRTNEHLSLLETCELKGLIHYEIIMSGLKGREFVKEHKIYLGLQSSLRAINEKRTSCVLISHTIKPKFVIDQIVYFSKQKSSSVPVYVVDNLGTFSESMFGIRALVISFPLKLPGKLSEWIWSRNCVKTKPPHKKKSKPPPTKVKELKEVPKFDVESVYLHRNFDRAFIPQTVVKNHTIKPPIQIREWSGDFIPFKKADVASESKNELVSKDEFEKEKDKVLEALRGMTNHVKCREIRSFRNETERSEGNNHVNIVKLPKIVYEENDDDDFLSQYEGTGVTKIQGNPKRKPKKKKAKKQTGNKKGTTSVA